MTDPKLVISKDVWGKFSTDEKLEIAYDTIISTRESNAEVAKKVDALINKPVVCPHEKRIDSLEKWKVVKSIATIFGGFLSGFGGSHIPK